MDFTIRKYVQLLNKLAEKGYVFQTFEYFIEHSYESKIVVLRHDVDRNPENALRFAFIENKLGIKASYYFRIGRKVFKEDIIKKIVTLGHEVGYHYEDLTICKGIFENAIIHFGRQLASFRTIYPVRTICMHGSPLSKWDNRKLWERYDYHNYGIIAEPYFDVDYSKVYYITDTGRAWNNRKSSIRDKVKIFFKIRIQDTTHLIALIRDNKMPDKIIINTHPQRWFKPGIYWFREFILQNLKNIVKSLINKMRGNKLLFRTSKLSNENNISSRSAPQFHEDSSVFKGYCQI